MVRHLSRVFAILLITLIGVGISIGEASAAPSRATLQNAASRVEYENVGGPAYAAYKKKYPTKLNWTNDGCSVPKDLLSVPGLGGVLKNYSATFKHSCDRHDFGYRNYGSNTSTPGVHPKFDPDQYRKDTIDKRFLANMRIQCDKAYPHFYQVLAKADCYAAASIFYGAVNKTKQGHRAFFG
jgi:hypothetical protein